MPGRSYQRALEKALGRPFDTLCASYSPVPAGEHAERLAAIGNRLSALLGEISELHAEMLAEGAPGGQREDAHEAPRTGAPPSPTPHGE